MSAYRVLIDTRALRVLISRTNFPISDPVSVRMLGEAIRRYGALVQARAVRNVSGYPVVYNGQAFVVRVRTGTLKGSIELQWPFGSLFTARVYVNGGHMTPANVPGFPGRPVAVADYAGAIEWGHGDIDLKRTMAGKTVPFFGARSQRAQGPYAATGLQPLGDNKGPGSSWTSEALNAKLAGKNKGPMIFTKKGQRPGPYGSGSSAYFISFRKVGKTGWIIPAAKPRPFMAAAADSTRDQGRLLLVNAATEMLGFK